MKLTISTKLIVGFLIVSVITAIVGFIGISNVGKVGRAGDIILFEEVPVADAAMESMIALISGRDIAAEHLLETDLEKLPEIEAEFKKAAEDFDEWCSGIVDGSEELGIIATDNPNIIKLVEEAQEFHTKFEDAAEKMMEAHTQALQQQDVTLNASEQIARSYMEKVDEYSNSADLVMDEVEIEAQGEMAAAMDNADRVQASSRFILIAFSLAGVVIGMLIGIIISRSITKPTLKAVEVAQKIAEND